MSVIAEFSQNHNGDVELLWRMVDSATKAGTWACKIQTFFADDLTPEWMHDYERLKRLELDFQTHAKFASVCRDAGVTPMTSVYTVKYLPQLSDCGFKHIKIGSPYCTDLELIQTYTAFGFKMFVSTGGTELSKVPHIHPIECVMHCVSKYPASPNEANLSRLWEIKAGWPNSALGFSDHTAPYAPSKYGSPAYIASAMGVSYIEKHFTMLSPEATKDGPVSIGPSQLKELCDFDKLPIEERRGRLGLGQFISPQTQAERDYITKYRGRFKR